MLEISFINDIFIIMILYFTYLVVTMTNVKMIRIKKNIREAELARMLKISRSAVCDIEKRGSRSITTAKKYALILNCNPLELIELQ